MPYKRRKRRRKTTKRTIARSPMRKTSTKPEVKYFTLKQDQFSVRAGEFTPANTGSHGTWSVLNDIIAQIGQGTSSTARIGNKIHVLKITHRYWGSFCPARIGGPPTLIDMSSCTLRMIWHTGRVPPGQGISDFFAGELQNKIYAFPARRTYGIHRDTVKVYNSAWSVKNDPAAVIPPGTGYMIKGQYTMNVNRDIVIAATGDTPPLPFCRNDSDVYSLMMFAAIPYSITNAQFQALCLNSEYRIYYTDD